jgi:uncharacterized protein YxjI
VTPYTMRQPWLTIGDDLLILDDRGDLAFKVDGKLLSFRSSATIRDLQGQALMPVREVLLSLDRVTTLERNGAVLGTVKQTGSTSDLKARFSVETEGGQSLTVRDAGFRDYRIERGTSGVATIVKATTGLRDRYDIKVAAGEDVTLVLGVAVAIRQMARHSTD